MTELLIKFALFLLLLLLAALFVFLSPMLLAIRIATPRAMRVIVPGARGIWVLAFTSILDQLGWRASSRAHGGLGAGKSCTTCQAPIQAPSRATYCSQACREIAAEQRMRKRVHAERLADYGEVPF